LRDRTRDETRSEGEGRATNAQSSNDDNNERLDGWTRDVQPRPSAAKKANLDSQNHHADRLAASPYILRRTVPFHPRSFDARLTADVCESLCRYARVHAIVRRACAARVFRSPLSELVVSDDPPRAAYDSNSSSSSSSSSSNGVSGREMRTSRSREPPRESEGEWGGLCGGHRGEGLDRRQEQEAGGAVGKEGGGQQQSSCHALKYVPR